jgi:FkbM family methyltransferase
VSERGERELNGFEKLWFDARAALRASMVSEVAIQDGPHRTVFLCENRTQAYRALSLWVKEAGTMEWIDKSVRPGERFLDIGANVGIYTLAAAHRVGAGGRVYAVEPHKPNAVSLMRNVLRNKLQDRVDVLTTPLADQRMVATFYYKDLSPSSTGSQLDATNVSGKEFIPAASEVVLGLSVDELLEVKAIEAPHHVKIDVDGIELSILRGMTALLGSAERPRSVQVELNVGEHEAIESYMNAKGYKLDHRHFTANGKRQLAEGKETSQIAHNAVFVPADAA